MAEEGARQSGAALREPVLQDGERIGNLEAPEEPPPHRPPWEVDELPGALGPQQITGEYMESDPDWPSGCWCGSYLKMNAKFITKARQINAETAQHRQERRSAAGQEDVNIADSMKLLREQVFSLCPLHFLLTGMVVSFALTVMTFLVPYYQGRLLDACMDALAKYRRGEEIDEMAILGPKLAIVGALMFGSYFCEVAVGILFAISGHTTVTRLRIKLFRNLTVQDVAFYDVHSSGELSSRLINDSAALSSLTQFTTQTLLGAIVKFTGSLVAMYGTHWWLALIATILTPVNTMLVRKTGRTVGHYGTLQNAAMAQANALAVEVLGNIRTVQSNVGETQEAVYFMDRLNYYLRVIKGTVYLETMLRFTSYGLSKVRDMVVLAIAMHQVIHGSLSIGQYTAFMQYIGLYEDGFNNMGNIWISFKTTITATGKFVQLLLRKPEISPDVGGMQPVVCTGKVEFRDVCFSYQAQPDLQVLTRMNLTANPGDTVALVGESGAGKSTIGRLLQRYYNPSSGRILLDGADLSSLGLWWLRAQLGVVEQEPVLFNRPLQENISYGSARGKTVAEVEFALDLARASKFVGEMPNGLQTYPGEKAARMSGGQKQRIAIARAVLRNPKVLLLDEATSSLDSENEYLVQQAIDSIMQERQATTFVIAHRLSTVKAATKIIVIQKGSCMAVEGTGFASGVKLRDSLVEQGTHNELMKRDGAYAKYMKHQVVEQPEKAANLLG